MKKKDEKGQITRQKIRMGEEHSFIFEEIKQAVA